MSDEIDEEYSPGFYDDEDNLLLEFDSDAVEFIRGFQIGQLFQLMELDEEWIEANVYATNAEMVMRLCESKDYDFKAEILLHPDNIEPTEWVHVLLVKRNTPRPKRTILHPDRGE